MAPHQENPTTRTPWLERIPYPAIFFYARYALFGALLGSIGGFVSASTETVNLGDSLLVAVCCVWTFLTCPWFLLPLTCVPSDSSSVQLGTLIGMTGLILTILGGAEAIGAPYSKRALDWHLLMKAVRFWMLILMCYGSAMLMTAVFGPSSRQIEVGRAGVIGALWGLLFGWWEYTLTNRITGEQEKRRLCPELDALLLWVLNRTLGLLSSALVPLLAWLVWLFVRCWERINLPGKLEWLEKKYDMLEQMVSNTFGRASRQRHRRRER